MIIKLIFFYITFLYSLSCYSIENNKSDFCKGRYIGDLEKYKKIDKKIDIKIVCDGNECWENKCTKNVIPKPKK